jgi:hypothetical protein
MDASGYLPNEVPSHWQVYFSVEDTDAAVERALTMGGSLLDGPADSDFGRVAQLADPMGGVFKVISTPSCLTTRYGSCRPELSLKLPAGILCVMAGTFRPGHQPKH